MCSILNEHNFTGESDESEFFPKREIGNSLVKSMWVTSLHQVNCKNKNTIPDTADHHQKLKLRPMKWQHKFNSLAFFVVVFLHKDA